MASSDQSSSTEDMETEFKHFDVVPEIPSDHHFLSSNGKSSKHFTSDGNPNLYKKIMQEWKILGKNLPESIYVRVFETRIDLLRAVIIGSPNTPYHNGLFFFDIVLPYLYPNEPPKVYYRSHGYRLNPNLYGGGKVCLSLLNTWYGNKEEQWSKESTILQILVSIQGLVLNERPYFNEPAYANQKNSLSMGWINASLGYNYTALILSCETMMQIKRNPPVCFEAFVAQHFKDRAGSILAFVEEYRDGHALGGQFPLNYSNPRINARSFKTRLDQVHLKLKKEFGCNNIDSETNNAVHIGGIADSVSMDIEQVANGSSSGAHVVAIPMENRENVQAFACCASVLLVLIFVISIVVIEVIGRGNRSS